MTDNDDVFVDDKGTTWNRPTAWAYAQACRVIGELKDENGRLRTIVANQDGNLWCESGLSTATLGDSYRAMITTQLEAKIAELRFALLYWSKFSKYFAPAIAESPSNWVPVLFEEGVRITEEALGG